METGRRLHLAAGLVPAACVRTSSTSAPTSALAQGGHLLRRVATVSNLLTRRFNCLYPASAAWLMTWGDGAPTGGPSSGGKGSRRWFCGTSSSLLGSGGPVSW